MSWAVLCGALVAGAVWLALPASSAGLRRLRPPGRPVGSITLLLAGRAGGPPLRQRAGLGLGATALVLALAPGTIAWSAPVVGLCATVALGWLLGPRPPDPAIARQFPATLELLAACLGAGSSMRGAVETVAAVSPAPTSGLLRQVGGQLRLGRAEADAWAVLAGDPQWGTVAGEVTRSGRSGTSLVHGLRVHAEDQRRRADAERTKAARAVGVRSVVPLMVCFLPAFVLVGVVPIVAGLLSGLLG